MIVASEIDSDRRETLGESDGHCILRPAKARTSVGVCLTNPLGWGMRSYENGGECGATRLAVLQLEANPAEASCVGLRQPNRKL